MHRNKKATAPQTPRSQENVIIGTLLKELTSQFHRLLEENQRLAEEALRSKSKSPTKNDLLALPAVARIGSRGSVRSGQGKWSLNAVPGHASATVEASKPKVRNNYEQADVFSSDDCCRQAYAKQAIFNGNVDEVGHGHSLSQLCDCHPTQSFLCARLPFASPPSYSLQWQRQQDPIPEGLLEVPSNLMKKVPSDGSKMGTSSEPSDKTDRTDKTDERSSVCRDTDGVRPPVSSRSRDVKAGYSLAVEAGVGNIFPRWFNPYLQDTYLGDRRHSIDIAHVLKMSADTGLEGWESVPSSCILKPLAKTRLIWNFIWSWCLAFEIWITPIDLVYVETGYMPTGLDMISAFTMVFFMLDIGLNFFTGYMSREKFIERGQMRMICLCSRLQSSQKLFDDAFDRAARREEQKAKKYDVLWRKFSSGLEATLSKQTPPCLFMGELPDKWHDGENPDVLIEQMKVKALWNGRTMKAALKRIENESCDYQAADEENEAVERLEAEKRAWEQAAAAKQVAAETLAAERVAAVQPVLEQTEAAKNVAVKLAAAEQAAVEKKEAVEISEAEKAAAEQAAIEQHAAAEQLAVEEAAASFCISQSVFLCAQTAGFWLFRVAYLHFCVSLLLHAILVIVLREAKAAEKTATAQAATEQVATEQDEVEEVATGHNATEDSAVEQAVAEQATATQAAGTLKQDPDADLIREYDHVLEDMMKSGKEADAELREMREERRVLVEHIEALEAELKVQGKKHGRGTYNYAKDGTKLVGDWEQGKITSGEWIFPNGTFYSGKFRYNKPHGKGVWIFKNGNQLTGEYLQKEKATDDEPPADDDDAPRPDPEVWCSFKHGQNVSVQGGSMIVPK